MQTLEVFSTLATAGTGIDLSEVDTATLVNLLGRASDEQLAAVAGSPKARALVLGEVFRRMRQHLRADRARNADGVIRWRIDGGSGPDGYDRFHTVIAAGGCETVVDCGDEPRVTITLSPVDFIRLTSGTSGIAALLAARRLKIKGELRYALRVNGMFDIPKPRP